MELQRNMMRRSLHYVSQYMCTMHARLGQSHSICYQSYVTMEYH